jgi:hypothetical protein
VSGIFPPENNRVVRELCHAHHAPDAHGPWGAFVRAYTVLARMARWPPMSPSTTITAIRFSSVWRLSKTHAMDQLCGARDAFRADGDRIADLRRTAREIETNQTRRRRDIAVLLESMGIAASNVRLS